MTNQSTRNTLVLSHRKRGDYIARTKREQILQTALTLFNERGFHNTPTSLIAKEANVCVGTLFNLFSTKEELIQELYLSIKQTSQDYFKEQLHHQVIEVDTFKRIWRMIIKWNLSHADEFYFIRQFSHTPYFKHLDHDIESYKKIREFVLRFVTDKEIIILHPEYSIQYLGSIISSATEYIKTKEIIEIDTCIDMTFDLFWNGFSRE